MNSQNPADSNSSFPGANAWDPAASASPPPFSGFGPQNTAGQADGSAFGGAPQPHAAPPSFGGQSPATGGFPASPSGPPNGFHAPFPQAQAQASASPPPPQPPAEEVVSVSCPVCGHGLKLRREHLGIEGNCVSCGEGIVAIDAGPAGVVIERVPKVVSPPVDAPPPRSEESTKEASPSFLEGPPPMVSWNSAPEPSSSPQFPAENPPAGHASSPPPRQEWPSDFPAPSASPTPPTSTGDFPGGGATPDSAWSAPTSPAPEARSEPNWNAGFGDARPSPEPASFPTQAQAPTGWETPSSSPPTQPQAAASAPNFTSPAPSPESSPAFGTTPQSAPLSFSQASGFSEENSVPSQEASPQQPGFSAPNAHSAAPGSAPSPWSTGQPAGPSPSASPGPATPAPTKGGNGNAFATPDSQGFGFGGQTTAPAGGFGSTPGVASGEAGNEAVTTESARQEGAPPSAASESNGFGGGSGFGATPGTFGAAPSNPEPRQAPLPSNPSTGPEQPQGFFQDQPAAPQPQPEPGFSGASGFGAAPARSENTPAPTPSNPAQEPQAQPQPDPGFGSTQSQAPASSPEPSEPESVGFGGGPESGGSTSEGNFGNLFASSPASREQPEAAPAAPSSGGNATEDAAASFASLFGNLPKSQAKSEGGQGGGDASSAWELPDTFGSGGKPTKNEPDFAKSTGAADSAPGGAEDAFAGFGTGPEKNEASGNGNASPSMSEGFSSLFGSANESESEANTPWGNSQLSSSPDGKGKAPESDSAEAGFDFSASSAATAKPDADTPKATISRPEPSSKRKKKKNHRVFSPLVVVVMVLGALFLGGIFLLKHFGGVDGLKSRVKAQLEGVLSGAGKATATMVEPAHSSPPTPATPAVPGEEAAPATPPSSAPPAAAETNDNPPPATPTTPAEPPSAPSPPEPDPLAPAEASETAAGGSPSATGPETVANSAVEASQPPQPDEQAGATEADLPPVPASEEVPASITAVEPELALPPEPQTSASPSPAAPSSQPAPQPQAAGNPNPAAGAQAAAPAAKPATEEGAAKPDEAPEDPGKRVAAILEPVGTEVIESFYQSDSIDERASFVIDREENQPHMEAYYRRYQQLPTLRKVSFRGPMRDAASGRWFGVFDVWENENEEIHRWCVVQVRPGELKMDWVIYQQLIDESLDRFLSDPAAPPKEFRLVVRRGEEAPSDENPWPGTTWELELTPPLDTSAPRVLLVKDADFQRLGLDRALVGGNARIGRVELGWVPSDLEPLTRVPTLTKVLGWGAW